MTETAIVPAQQKPQNALAAYTREQLDILKNTIARGLSDMEFGFFLEVCARREKDPFRKRVYPVKRWDQSAGCEVIALQDSIDSYREDAQATGEYRGQVGPLWCGPDGKWTDIWLSDEPPAAAKVGVIRKGFAGPVWGIARYKSYVQRKKDGTPTRFWVVMPDNQLAKCAEAQALRKAFPDRFAGSYTEDEMGSTALEVQYETVDQPALTPAAPLAALTERLAAKETRPAKAQPKATQAASGPEEPGYVTREEMDYIATAAAKAQGASGDPGAPIAFPLDGLEPWDGWSTAKVGGKSEFAEKTWGELAEGSRDGKRHQFLRAAVGHAWDAIHERAAEMRDNAPDWQPTKADLPKPQERFQQHYVTLQRLEARIAEQVPA